MFNEFPVLTPRRGNRKAPCSVRCSEISDTPEVEDQPINDDIDEKVLSKVLH